MKSFIHPFLFTIFPILFLFSHNVGGGISISEIIIPSAVALGFAALLLLFLSLLLKDRDRVGIVGSIILILFFSYGHVFEIVRHWRIGSLDLDNHVYLMLVWCEMMVSGIYFFVKTPKGLENVTQFANIVAATLVVMSLGNIGFYEFSTRDVQQSEVGRHEQVFDSVGLDARSDPPDIYYVILDGYASSSTLEAIYGYDNHDFIKDLIERGFFVASESRSNYPTTYHSLASSLNMDYVNHLADSVGVRSSDLQVLAQMIEDNWVVEFLKAQGYTFIHLSSGWGPTESNRHADLSSEDFNMQCGAWGGIWDEFVTLLIQTTMLRPFSSYIIGGDARAKILCAFSMLIEARRIEGPKFVFAHILSPHPPFLFGRDGEPVPETLLKLDGYVWEQKEAYVDQLIFINKQVEVLVDDWLAKSKTPPVIILQADHGSASSFGGTKSPEWEQPTQEMLEERFHIFNAYYLPGNGDDLLYDSITPVNTFRLIFNVYFDTSYDLLEDRSYHVTHNDPYVFTDVTQEVALE